MANEVKFHIKMNVDGKEHIVEAASDVRKLAEEMGVARSASDELRNTLLKFNNLSQSFQNVITGLQQITGVLSQYTGAAAVQEEAESKLANNMRNTMDAREDEVKSILELVSAQQKLGVIGDEIQLNGAQELATYLTKKSTLERLIPVMNDMLAQQYGLNATSEAAANIASMLGKVMDGQVGALSRYGYKFDEAQEQVLRFGTEEARAAVLAEVVESAVGGMNEALAQTDAGKAKQASNDIGDLKEQIGMVVARIEPAIMAVNEFGTSIMGISTMVMGLQGIATFGKSLLGLQRGLSLTTLNSRIASGAVSLFGRVAGMSSMSIKAGATAVRGLTWALRGLEIATGIGIAFVALQGVIETLGLASDKTAGSMDSLTAASERQRQRQQAVNDARAAAISQTELHKQKLEELLAKQKQGIDVKKEEQALVNELNNTYGQTMGYFDSVSKWYKALTKNSEAYCEQLVIEAEMRELANEYADLSKEKRSLWFDDDGKMKKGFTRTRQETTMRFDRNGRDISVTKTIEGSFEKTQRASRQLDTRLKGVKTRMKELAVQAGEIKMPVMGSPTAPTPPVSPASSSTTPSSDNAKQLQLIADARSYEELMNNVSWYEEQLEKTDKTETQTIARLQRLRDAARDAADSIKKSGESVSAVDYGEDTIEGIDNKISLYGDEQRRADAGRIYELQQEIDRLTDKRNVLSVGIDITSFEDHLSSIRLGETSIDELTGKVEELQELLSNTDIPFGTALETKLRQLISRYKMLIGVSEKHGEAEESTQEKLSNLEGLQGAASSVEQLAQSFQSLGEESKAFAGSMVVVSLAASLSQLIAGMVKKANESTLTIWDWIAGIGAGTAAAVSAATQLKGIGVFAKGGVVSGPTLALVGGYAGASNNPEVIASLDKLRSMLKEDSDVMSGDVEFRIRYDDLVGILRKGHRKSLRG